MAALAIAAVTVGALTVTSPPTGSTLTLGALAQWDGGWYLAIARGGYWYTPGQQGPVAFFPGYPLLVRVVGATGLPLDASGALVSLACGVGAMAMFLRWARTVVDEDTARWATWLLVLYPFSMYLYGVVYSDGLFLLLVVSAFWAVETDRPFLAAVLGILATLTRPVAPAVVLGLTARSLERRWRAGEPVRPVHLVPALAGLGLVAWMAYLDGAVGDALAFAHVQGAPGWDQPPGWRTWLKVTWFETLFPDVAPLVAVRLGGHALVTLVALGLVWPTRKVLGAGYFVYVAVAAGMPALASKDFMGLGRYIIGAFPLFVTVASLLASAPRTRRVVAAGSAALLLVFAFAFGRGGYVS